MSDSSQAPAAPVTFTTVKAKVYTDATGACTDIPAILTSDGILESVLDYCISRSHNRSLAWMRKVIRSAGLFIDYRVSNPDEQPTYRLFQNFAQRLYTGSFDRETGLDPSGLCWQPRAAEDASHIITHLTDLFEWLGDAHTSAAALNPRYAGSRHDRLVDAAAYQYRRDKAFLGHNWAANAALDGGQHRVRARRVLRVEKGEPPAFPDGRFMELLMSGFKTGERYDYRGMLITLLLHSAGFRESEPFHLYVGDVFPDPANTSSARVPHPPPQPGRGACRLA